MLKYLLDELDSKINYDFNFEIDYDYVLNLKKQNEVNKNENN